MAMAGVLAVAHVGHDEEFRNLPTQRAYGPLDDPVLIVGAGGHLVLGFRQPEKNHAADAQRLNFGALFDEFIHGHLVIPRHGADFAFDALPRAHKQGQNEARRIETRLANQAPQSLGGA